MKIVVDVIVLAALSVAAFGMWRAHKANQKAAMAIAAFIARYGKRESEN
jgi:hypothetical protein